MLSCTGELTLLFIVRTNTSDNSAHTADVNFLSRTLHEHL
jgi:hypothetical protein